MTGMAGSAAPPIFMVGFQRSGTTLLQSLLGSHSRIAGPPETHFLVRVSQNRRYLGDLSDDANLRRAVAVTLAAPGGALDECGFEEERVFERARQAERSYGGLLDAVMSDYAERHGKVRWSEKTPGQRPRKLLALRPDAQIVHVLRDPRDAVASSHLARTAPSSAAGADRTSATARLRTRAVPNATRIVTQAADNIAADVRTERDGAPSRSVRRAGPTRGSGQDAGR